MAKKYSKVTLVFLKIARLKYLSLTQALSKKNLRILCLLLSTILAGSGRMLKGSLALIQLEIILILQLKIR